MTVLATVTASACAGLVLPTSATAAPTSSSPVAPAAAASTGFNASDLDASGQTVPDTAYPVPTGAVYLATSGVDTNTGTAAAPVRTLNAAYALVPSGGTIVVQGGVYRDWLHNSAGTSYGYLTKPVTIQAAPHAQVWFDGTDVEPASVWTSDGAGHWSLPWDTPQFCDGHYDSVAPTSQNTDNTGPCAHIDATKNAANPLAGDPQMAFVNGTSQHEVATLAAATAGNFYYDWAHKRLYVSTNPSAATVELARRPIALVVSADNVVVRGVGFRRYATNEYTNVTSGALFSAAPHQGTVLENDVFTRMAAQGVAAGAQNGRIVHSVFVDNGFTGIGSNGDQHGSKVTDNLQVLSNVISRNNAEHFDDKCTLSCAASGIKIAHMDGFTMQGNIVQGNIGAAGGLWCDLACSHGVIIDNLVTDNGTFAINYEVSDTGIIASNLVLRNGLTTGSVALRIVSANTAVYNNTLVGNLQSISVIDDARTYGVDGWTDVGPDTSNVRMANNVVVGTNYSLQAYPISNSSVAPNTGADQFFSSLDYDSYYQQGTSLALVLWRQLGGAETDYQTVPAFTAAKGWESHGYSLRGTDTTDPEGDPFFVDAAHGNYTVRASSAAYNSGAALPSDVAAALGVPSGTVTSRGAMSYPGVPAAAPGAIVPVAPAALIDTRSGLGGTTGPVKAATTVTAQVDGQGGVPLRGVAAAVVEISVITPTTAGYLVAYAAGGSRPSASNASVTAGRTSVDRAVVPVSAAGAIMLYLGIATGGTAQLQVTVSGYVVGGTSSSPGAYVPITSARVLDTRGGVGAPQAPVTSGTTLAVQFGGMGGVPAGGVSAVVVGLTAVGPTQSGYLSAYADGATRTVASVEPIVLGHDTHNLAVVPVSAAGKIDIYPYLSSGGHTDLVADVYGYLRSGTVTTPGDTVALNPTRVLDTRSGVGATGPVAAGGVAVLHLAGVAGIPAAGASAVVLNLTATGATAAGTLTAWAGGTARPAVTDLGFLAGETTSVATVVPLAPDGAVDIVNTSSGTVSLVGDVAGYVVAGQG